jgi:hypothetical protein
MRISRKVSLSVLSHSALEGRISWFVYGKWGRWRCFEFLNFAFSCVDGGEI